MDYSNDLEIVEVYELLGERRYRLHLRGTILYVNVAADSEDEAKRKASDIIRQLGFDKIIDLYREDKQ